MDVTYEGLFRGICDNPDDNLLRQIIADWYEEQPTTVHCTSCNGLGYFTKNYGNIPCTKCGGRVINYGYANGTGQIQTGTKQRADFIRTQIAVEEALGEKKDSSTLTTQQVNALVLKMHNLWCESRTSVDVVRQIIAEQTGIAPDFHSTSWSDGDWLVICHDSNGNVVSGYGDGFGYGVDYGAGYGDGYNYGDNEGDGSGNRTWFTVHDGNGYGAGYGNANGDGCGNGFD